MAVRTVPPFTIQPDNDDPHEHQERDRSVQCTRCARTTWNVHATCDNCITAGHLWIKCDCNEGRRARAAQ